jgi:hypothetical protein
VGGIVVPSSGRGGFGAARGGASGAGVGGVSVIGLGGDGGPLAGSGGVRGGRGGASGARGGSGDAGGMALGRGGSGCGPVGQPMSCLQAVCGNGAIDSCSMQWTTYDGFCFLSTQTEECDGLNLGGQTCMSYSGLPTGTLRCSPDCSFDASGCSACSDDPGIIRCGVAPLPQTADTFALGASASEVAIAWLSGGNGLGAPRLQLSRLTPELDIEATTELDDPVVRGPFYLQTFGLRFDVAPLPSGWVVAGFGGSGELFVHAVGGDGSDLGRFNLAPQFPGVMYVVPQPDGGRCCTGRRSRPRPMRWATRPTSTWSAQRATTISFARSRS